MKIAILGAGAMGSVFGAHLSRAGQDVTLVDVNRDHMEAVQRAGLWVEGVDDTTFHTWPRAVLAPGELAPVDAVIVLTKAYSTVEAARSIAHAVGERTWVLTVQNGLGNDRRLAEVFGPDRVLPGVTTVGAEWREPGRVAMSAQTARGTSITHLGAPRTATSMPDGARQLAATLSSAGLPAIATEDTDQAIWLKLSLAAMGPLSAMLRRTVLDVFEDPHGHALLRRMFDEIVDVAHACGVSLDRDQAWHHAEATYRGTGHHMTSMCGDVVNHRPTEIDAMCLEVVRLGEQHGVATPVCEVVGHAVSMLQATYERAY